MSCQKLITMTIIFIKNQQDQLDGHRRGDSSALESSEDEEKAGGEGDGELRHKPVSKVEQ